MSEEFPIKPNLNEKFLLEMITSLQYEITSIRKEMKYRDDLD